MNGFGERTQVEADHRPFEPGSRRDDDFFSTGLAHHFHFSSDAYLHPTQGHRGHRGKPTKEKLNRNVAIAAWGISATLVRLADAFHVMRFSVSSLSSLPPLPLSPVEP